MGLNHSPRIVTNGLVVYLDAANRRSYPGSGSTWYDLSGLDNHISFPDMPTWDGTGFTFNGTTNYGTANSNLSNTITVPSVMIGCTVANGTALSKGQAGGFYNYGILGLTASTFRMRNTPGDYSPPGTFTAASGTNIYACAHTGSTRNYYHNNVYLGDNGLVMNFDPANRRIYSGTGNVAVNYANTDIQAIPINNTLYSANNGGTFDFNGSNNYIAISRNDWWKTVSSTTFQYWSKNNSGSGYSMCYQKGGWEGYTLTPGGVNYSGQSGSNDCALSIGITNGVWYMSTFVIDREAGFYYFYVNTILRGSKAIVHPAVGVVSRLHIGARGDVPDTYFNGSIGLVQVFNRALSAEEIRQSFEAMRSRYGI